jgi:hypothetical protein
VDGKEKKITFTRALHTPTLNANLISISAFDKAGLLPHLEVDEALFVKVMGALF